MGLCFSSQVKVKNIPSYSESNPKHENTYVSERVNISTNKLSSSYSELPTICSKGEMLQESNLRNFTFDDLKVATKNFRPKNILGEGRFGYGFKGSVGGKIIAVKKLKYENTAQAEWMAQVKFLGQLYHPNLVKLVGYCIENEQRFLVHEFIPRGSLENHIFRRRGGSYFKPLSWNLRLYVALGAAKGLAFLHSLGVNILHGDFKTSSILLDSKYNAKLSDFGLAKPDDETHICARVIGTHIYASPEYIGSGHLTPKGNVYSFGVLLLEMLSGRRALDMTRSLKETNLVVWAKPYLANKRKVLRVLDNRLEGQYTNNAAHSAAVLARKCLSNDFKLRPTMEQVVKLLEELLSNETCPAQTR